MCGRMGFILLAIQVQASLYQEFNSEIGLLLSIVGRTIRHEYGSFIQSKSENGDCTTKILQIILKPLTI